MTPTTKPYGILAVDDSVVVRMILNKVISDDPQLEVVGTAAHGGIALNKLQTLKPDLVLLDMHMPEMDGLATLAEIKKTHPKLPVIMFSSVSQQGAKDTLEALDMGARDFVPKPQSMGNQEAGETWIRDVLVPKIKQFLPNVGGASTPTLGTAKKEVVLKKTPLQITKINAVAIGISTGGPKALDTLMPKLPANLKVPVVVVQHMPEYFTKSLADRLNEKSPLHVVEGEAGMTVAPGSVYIAPGGLHMEVAKEGEVVKLVTNQNPHENSCRPAVDVLFRSVAKVYGHHALAVIMTGMGQDGMLGCKVLGQAGAPVIIQDEASSVVWGMPGAVAEAGLAQGVYPLSELADQITQRVNALP